MTRYRIRSEIYDAGDDRLQGLLSQIYELKERPECMCVPQGVPMYLARVEGKFLIKRMPNTGCKHFPECESFEPPEELSGLGQVKGAAIQEDDAGITTLRLDASLTKGATRKAPTASDTEADTVRTDGSKLTLRGLLHFLWEKTGFSRWSPAMMEANGRCKRHWGLIRYHLLRTAESSIVKGSGLSELLYIPEPYQSEHKDEIAQRRLALLGKHMPQGTKRSLLVLVAEVKEIGTSRYGYKIMVKHCPDYPFFLEEDIHRRLEKRFAVELALMRAEQGRLLIVATFSVTAAGAANIEEAALMPVTEEWIPFENPFEFLLLAKLRDQGRRFFKCLRYNMASDKPMATAVLTDTGAEPTALYVVQPAVKDEYLQGLNDFLAESELPSWRWDGGGPMEDLPPRQPGKAEK